MLLPIVQFEEDITTRYHPNFPTTLQPCKNDPNTKQTNKDDFILMEESRVPFCFVVFSRCFCVSLPCRCRKSRNLLSARRPSRMQVELYERILQEDMVPKCSMFGKILVILLGGSIWEELDMLFNNSLYVDFFETFPGLFDEFFCKSYL